MFIEQPAIYLRWLYPRAYWRMDRRVKAVYLTFDDGPIPEATPFILDTLKEFGVRATFFMVGDNVRKYPELYKRILAEGHRKGIQLQRGEGQRLYTQSLCASTTRLDAYGTVCLAEQEVQDCDVGPGDPRLLEMDDRRRCGA